MEPLNLVIAVLSLYAVCICGINAADPCYDHEHPEQGLIGNCIPATACSNGDSLPGLCPSYSADYTCCFDENFPGRELRGVWIATVANIDWPLSPASSVAVQQESLKSLVDNIALAGLNTIYFQVRPAGDALYASQIEPWSKYLTGAQGQAPEPFWDPLAFIIEYAHGKGIEIHAWINPYRAKMENNPEGLDPMHMALQFPEYAYPFDSYIWMDPGAMVVQNRTYDVVIDLTTRYDLDGIHMDDYFYPYPVTGVVFPDDATYQEYLDGEGTLSLEDWRRFNVNQLIQRLNQGIHEVKPWVKFSISPFGIYRPCQPEDGGMPCSISGLDQYSALYSDAKRWLVEGWIDALIPQLYWRIEPPQQSYPVLLDWWVSEEQNPLKRHVYAGNYLTRIELQNWPLSEIYEQIRISRSQANRARGSWGNVQFSAIIFRDNVQDAISYFNTTIYPYPALQPKFPWLGTRITGKQ